MKTFLYITFILFATSCTPKQDSLESIANEVIKKKEGLDIQFKPIDQKE